MTTSAQRLRSILAAPRATMVAGAYDCLSAKLVEEAGFDCLHVGGYALSSTLLGQPDLSLLTLTEAVGMYSRISDAVNIPIIADGDTGFGSHFTIRRLIMELEKSGIAGVHIEDQSFPKRCGHFNGQSVIPTNEMVQRIKMAVDARASDDFVVIARTDALSAIGFEEAICRSQAYVEAGADVIFVEAPLTYEQAVAIPKRIPAPTLYNWAYQGKSPALSFDELEDLGYRIILFTDTMFAVVHSIRAHLQELRKTGDYISQRDRMADFGAFNNFIGLPYFEALEQNLSAEGAPLKYESGRNR